MADAKDASRRIVFTGASGGIGTMIRPLLAPLYPGLVLSDKVEPKNLLPGETFVAADLTKPDEVAAAVKGADSVIHLGGYSVEGPWDAILQANIIGCYNLFEAARQAGVKRVVFASSNHAVGFYPRRRKIGTDVTVRPDSRYGVSKAFGEALGALYSDKHGMIVTCLRIGNVGPRPLDVRRLSIWISPEDIVQLIRIGLEHPDIRFDIVYGASDNAASLVGQFARPSARLSSDRQGRGSPRACRGRASKDRARSGRRSLPGRHFLRRPSSPTM